MEILEICPEYRSPTQKEFPSAAIANENNSELFGTVYVCTMPEALTSSTSAPAATRRSPLDICSFWYASPELVVREPAGELVQMLYCVIAPDSTATLSVQLSLLSEIQ